MKELSAIILELIFESDKDAVAHTNKPVHGDISKILEENTLHLTRSPGDGHY